MPLSAARAGFGVAGNCVAMRCSTAREANASSASNALRTKKRSLELKRVRAMKEYSFWTRDTLRVRPRPATHSIVLAQQNSVNRFYGGFLRFGLASLDRTHASLYFAERTSWALSIIIPSLKRLKNSAEKKCRRLR